jgi:electron transfer flavoprotein alpha subunit
LVWAFSGTVVAIRATLGRGYELGAKLVELIREKLGVKSELGATRALIYAELKELEGLVTSERQVGQTGKTVAPEVYVAVGDKRLGPTQGRHD